MITSLVGVVTYHPNEANLRAVVSQVAPDAAAVVVYANSPVEPSFEQELRTQAGDTPLVVVSRGENLGLGTAYNAIVALARRFGATHLLLLDQDSTPSFRMLPQLEKLFQDLGNAGEQPAAVGPRPVATDGQAYKQPRQGPRERRSAALPAEFIISSGSLISLEAAQAVGPFREDFFIDAIDVEWCFRAWHRGWSVWLAEEIVMAHELGQGVISVPFGLRLTDQPPHRLYTYIRNQIAMLRLSHIPVRRKIVTLAYLPFQCLVFTIRTRFSRAILRAIGAGIAHGLTNRLGAPHKAWAWIQQQRAR